MKEMAYARDDCHWKYLWARPIHHRCQRHRVVLLAMNHQRFHVRLSRNRRDRESTGRDPHQYQRINLAPGMELGKGVRRDKCAERKSSQGKATDGR
ncbi:MAG: hypothetical protein RLZZ296_1443, partial [Pseudomonadota bacterium]